MQEQAEKVVKKIQNAGFKAFFAGGCVRDMLLNRPYHDIDIATEATPDQVEQLFPKTLAIGKKFGVIVVIENGFHFEVTTFRKDDQYDGRRPKSVLLVDNAREDAKRRDLTINSLFYDPVTREFFDYVNGLSDLTNKVVRLVGNPDKRLKEDKLRLLRVIRFATIYGFEIEEMTFTAVKRHAQEILSVSAERIQVELTKMFVSKAHKALDLLDKSGLLQHILPEVAALKKVKQSPDFHPEDSSYNHVRLAMMHTPPDPVVRYATLLHDIGKAPTAKFCPNKNRITFYEHAKIGAQIAFDVLTRLHFPSDFRSKVVWLVRNHMRMFSVKTMKKSTLIKLFRHSSYKNLLHVHKADILSSNKDEDTYTYILEKETEFNLERTDFRPKPLINGFTLQSLGLKPSPVFSQILSNIEDLQLEGKLTTQQQAIQYVKEKLI